MTLLQEHCLFSTIDSLKLYGIRVWFSCVMCVSVYTTTSSWPSDPVGINNAVWIEQCYLDPPSCSADWLGSVNFNAFWQKGSENPDRKPSRSSPPPSLSLTAGWVERNPGTWSGEHQQHCDTSACSQTAGQCVLRKCSFNVLEVQKSAQTFLLRQIWL